MTFILKLYLSLDDLDGAVLDVEGEVSACCQQCSVVLPFNNTNSD